MIYGHKLFMRHPHDKREDWEVKEQIIKEEILPKYDIIVSLEDNPDCVRIMKNLGITVLQVHKGVKNEI